MIDEQHREAGQKLAQWIVANYRPGNPLPVIFIAWKFASEHYGLVYGQRRFSLLWDARNTLYSGGTAPTAFNSRTVATLKAIGIEIEPTGKESNRGEPKTANPIYRV